MSWSTDGNGTDLSNGCVDVPLNRCNYASVILYNFCFILCREHISALRDRERKHRQAIAAAKRNREQASKFLKETMSRYKLQFFKNNHW